MGVTICGRECLLLKGMRERVEKGIQLLWITEAMGFWGGGTEKEWRSSGGGTIYF